MFYHSWLYPNASDKNYSFSDMFWKIFMTICMHFIFPTVRDFIKFNNFVPIATIVDYIFLSFSPFYYFPKTILNLPVFISIQELFIEVVLSIKTLGYGLGTPWWVKQTLEVLSWRSFKLRKIFHFQKLLALYTWKTLPWWELSVKKNPLRSTHGIHIYPWAFVQPGLEEFPSIGTPPSRKSQLLQNDF